MSYLNWDETLFKKEEVFDPDYLPEVLFCREMQLSSMAANLRPAIRGSTPIHTLCFGPPATGKTSCIRVLFKELEGYVDTVYIRCPLMSSSYKIMARVFEEVCGQQPPQTGLSMTRLYDQVCKELDRSGRVLVVALDDINFLTKGVASEILYALLKHEEYGMKIGVVAAATEKMVLEPKVTSIFQPDEVYFPIYNKDEINKILSHRAKEGFRQGVVTKEALNRIIELTSWNCDIRFGIHLLRLAGIEAERRASKKVEVKDVENVHEGGTKVFLAKSVSALNSDEREALKIIYSTKGDMSSGEVFKVMKDEVGLRYTRFYEIVNKLERLRLIDVAMESKGQGRTRYIVKKYDPSVVMAAMD